MSTDIPSYIVASPDPTYPGLPGEDRELVRGLWRARLRALHLARTEQRPIAIYVWPECEHSRKRERGKLGDGWAVRFYSAGAPLITEHNERTVRKLAAHEEVLHATHTLGTLKTVLDTFAYAARDAGFPDIGDRMDALRADVERRQQELAPGIPDAKEGLQTKRWPRERREPLRSA